MLPVLKPHTFVPHTHTALQTNTRSVTSLYTLYICLKSCTLLLQSRAVVKTKSMSIPVKVMQ